MSSTESFFLPKEHKLTFTPDAVASGHFVVIDGSGNPSGFTALVASTPVVVEAINTNRIFQVTINNGEIAVSQEFDGMADDRLDDIEGDFVLTSTLETTLEDYVLTEDLDTAIADFITESDLTTALGDYVTEAELTTALADYEPLIVAGTFIPSPSAISETDLKDAIDDIRDLLIAKGIMEAEV